MKKKVVTNKRKHEGSDEENTEKEDSDVSLNKSARFDEEGGITIDDIYIPPLPQPPCSIDENGPRLIICKIINNNFKSYGETQILGPFHKYFNAIVGPNGSGKSNVIDSMLFVFGYRASKIRSKKLSVLLHKSEKYPNVESCTVSIYFKLIRDIADDFDDYEEIPNSEFYVSRTAHKDNSSYYQINGRKVQYKDVAILLRKHGVDLDHNRFLILQGEVEQISLMKPKAPNEHETGMLEYLEDIIGTVRYKEPLAKLEEKIEFLTEQRTEKLTRVNLAGKEKDELRAPMEEAINFLKMENEIIKKKNFLYQRHIKKVTDKLSDAEENKNKVVEEFDELKEKLATILKEKSTKEQDFRAENEKYDNLSKRKEKITESFNAANNQDENIRAEMVQVNNRRKKVMESLKKEKETLINLEKVPEKNTRDIEEYTNKQEELTKDQEKYEIDRNKALQSLREDTISLQENKEKLQTELVDLRKVVDETKAEFSLAESKLKIFTSGEETEKKKLETLKTEYEETKPKLTKHAETIKELKKQIPLTEKQLKDARTELYQNKIEEAKILSDIKSKRILVEERRNSMQANRSKGRVLDSLMREKQEGRLPGLFGRLGDLGAIDAKYDVAISTACRALDNIVVDTVDTAQWCIEFLRAHNIGRATFIALDKQEYLQHLANSTIQTPENIPRLFDLVRIEDQRVRTAFYYALRDTLVAKDLDQASRTAYGAKRFRVVTLGGDIIETSGTMSGGGNTVSRGRMGRQVATQTAQNSPQKMERMQEDLSRLEERARELRLHQCRLEDQINTLQGCVNNMKIDLEKASIEYESLQQHLPQLQAQIKKQEQIIKSKTTSPAELKKLQTLVEKKKEEFEIANENANKIQTQVDKINKEIKDKTDKKMGGVTKKLKECTDLLEKIKAEILKLRVAIKTAERNTKKSRDKIANMEQEKTDCENKMRSMQEKREEIEKDAAIMLDKIKQLTEELENGKEEFAAHRKAIDKLTEKANKLKAEKIEFDQKLFTLDKIITENKDTIHQTQHKLSQLKLQEVPEEPMEELKKYSDEELLQTDTRHMEIELKTQEEQVKTAKPNLTAIKEYQKKVANFIQRTKELDEISQKRTDMREFRDGLRKKRQTEFYEGFNTIARKLKEMYQLITLGGDAELEMVDSYDPFSEGVVLNVRPPKKSWKNITNLSGGEKTLSSLALVFALHYYKPSPLYFMDEIDAALDFKNVSIVANYIKERTKNTQFIIISLRSNMFELADHLIGIFKTYNITKVVTVNPRLLNEETNQKKDKNTDKNNQKGDSIPCRETEDVETQETENLPCQQSRISPTQESQISPSQESEISPTEKSRNSPTQESQISPTQESQISPTQESQISPTQESQTSPTQSRISPSQQPRVSSPQGSRISPSQKSQISSSEESQISPSQESEMIESQESGIVQSQKSATTKKGSSESSRKTRSSQNSSPKTTSSEETPKSPQAIIISSSSQSSNGVQFVTEYHLDEPPKKILKSEQSSFEKSFDSTQVSSDSEIVDSSQ